MGQRLPAIFVGDALGLDFLNSIATPVDTPIDWIDDGDGLLNWLEQAQLCPPMRSRAFGCRHFPANSTVADQARSLREWFRGFVRRHKGRPLNAKCLAAVGAAQSPAGARRILSPHRCCAPRARKTAPA